jgi:SAM-dependent methyltransferase
MNPDTYAAEVQFEKSHWWFDGRRRLFLRIAEALVPDHSAPILDIGTSTGGTLREFADRGYHNLSGLDLSPEAIRFCHDKGLEGVREGNADAMPFADASFDFVIAADVIEHVANDAQAVREVHRVLKPKRYAIFTVPAFQVLWSRQDDIAHHKRRYRLPELLGRLREAQFEVVEIYYFNYLLFLPILAARTLFKWLRIKVENEDELNSPMINRLFSLIFRADIATARHLHPPFGVSVFALVRRV